MTTLVAMIPPPIVKKKKKISPITLILPLIALLVFLYILTIVSGEMGAFQEFEETLSQPDIHAKDD